MGHKVLWLTLFFVISCGVDSDSHYENKHYGGDGGKNYDGVGDVRPNPVAKGEAVPGIDPNRVMIDQQFHAAFDYDTIMVLNDGKAPKKPSSFIKAAIVRSLPVSFDDGMRLQATYGDGQNRSLGKQQIVNRAGDNNVPPGSPSQSGLQVYDRLIGDPTCHIALACIDRMRFTPNSGEGSTYCYYHAGTDEGAAVPYAAAPNYQPEDFESAYGSYGPYTAKQFAGDQVDCTNPGSSPTSVENFVMEVLAIPEGDLSTVKQPAGSVPIDFGVRLTTVKQDTAVGTRPYIDAQSRIQSETKYFLNTALRKIVKLTKTVRGAVDQPFFHGVQVNVEFDLCYDYVDTGTVDNCPVE